MKVILAPGCDLDWLHSLNPWAHKTLAAMFRQGKHLRERTNHGCDMRWRQAGCTTYDRMYGKSRKRERDGHQRIVIVRSDEWNGFTAHGVRRQRAWVIDPDTGVVSEAPEAWVPVWTEFVGDGVSANFRNAMFGESARDQIPRHTRN